MTTPPRIRMVLDVDGTVSRVYGEAERSMHRELGIDAPYLPIDQAVIDSLDLQAQRPGVEVAWLTSWAKDQADVDQLVGGPSLQGRLRGSLVAWTTGRSPGLRFRSLMEHLERNTPDALIWIDDQAPRDAGRRLRDRFAFQLLVLRPELHTGITHSDVERVRSFLDKQDPSPSAEQLVGESWRALEIARGLDEQLGRTLINLADR